MSTPHTINGIPATAYVLHTRTDPHANCASDLAHLGEGFVRRVSRRFDGALDSAVIEVSDPEWFEQAAAEDPRVVRLIRLTR